MLIRIRRVVLLGDVVAEDEIGERLEAVRVAAGDVEGNRVLVPDVLGERLPGLAVEHDDASSAAQTAEEVGLAALVVVEAADHARAREGDVRLPGRLRQCALAANLHQPAALVLEAAQREADDPLDHQSWFAPPERTKSLTT